VRGEQAPERTNMADKASPKVGAKRSRVEDSDVADSEKPEAKVAKDEEAKVENGSDEKESVKGTEETKPAADEKKEDVKPASVPLFGSGGATISGFGGFGGFGSAKAAGEGFGAAASGGGFGGFSSGGGFGGFAKAAVSTENGFPALSTVFGDANKPKQLFGKSTFADDAGDDEDDDAAPESTPAETKPVITLQQEDVTTGEEDEEVLFTTDGALYEFVTEEGKAPSWKERGRGEMRLNRGKDGGARMVMRAKGNYRLILNAAMWKGQTFTKMEGGKGLSFPCKNAVNGPDAKMATFALKMRVSATHVVQQVEEFLSATQKALADLSTEDAPKSPEKKD
jgi:Ran-binding protein 3